VEAGRLSGVKVGAAEGVARRGTAVGERAGGWYGDGLATTGTPVDEPVSQATSARQNINNKECRRNGRMVENVLIILQAVGLP
jgi:hypothetical protein